MVARFVAGRYRYGVDLPDAAKALYALPPSRFVAERNALAAALAARGDPAAAAVRKLARPVGLAWVLNRLARERRRDVEALADAGDLVRRGQRRALAGAGAQALREAEETLRDVARRLRAEAAPILAAEGREVPDATLARVELLLRVGATGPAQGALRDGVLAREPAPGEELSGFTVLAGGRGTSAAAVRPAPAARRSAPRRDAAREAREERERAREAREQERLRARALADARRAAATAERRATIAARAAAEAERRAAEARERAKASRAELEELGARVKELEEKG